MFENSEKREGFSSGLAVFFASLGSAIGLGNIQRFPFLLGKYGGGAFLFVYLVCIVLVGIPLLMSEFFIGRRAQKNSVGAFRKLTPPNANPVWKQIGVVGAITTYIAMFYYSCISGWVYMYLFKAIKGDFAHTSGTSVETMFYNSIIGPMEPLIWQFIVLAIVAIILIKGVKNGIERITTTLMPLLFVLIVICDIKALTLPGALKGLNFLFHVDFHAITGEAILMALGLSFFKLSLGNGTMITYASYFTKDNNMIGTALKVAGADTLISILAGIAIFPTVFSFGIQPSAGQGLLFMTIPLIFSQMKFGILLLIAFFTLTSIAVTTAMISLMEVSVAYLSEERKINRIKAVVCTASIMFLGGILATLSANSKSVLGSITVFGQTFSDLFAYLDSNILLPILGLAIALFVGRVMKNKEELVEELTNHHTLNTTKIINALYFMLRYVTPILIIVVFLDSIGFLH